jgi:hypothetical protein
VPARPDPSHQTVRLRAGRHASPHAGACVMELASMLADEPFSDRPRTTSAVLGALLRTYNDGVDDERRQDLYPLAALIVGTAARRAVEAERAARCLAFTRAVGGAVPSGRAAMGMGTAEAAGTWAALAALRTGPAPEVHARVLALVEELAALRPRARWRLARRLAGPDPAQVVARALDDRPAPEEGAREVARVG